MPIYEYRCAGCRAKTTVLTLRVSEEVSPTCARCGGSDLSRLMSRFAMPRSDDDRLDDLTDGASGLDDDDPRAVARWMRSMGKELGEDAGEDFEEMVDDLEHGAPDGDGTDADGGDES
jgi:putative FmdB family regulatory protein